MTVCLLLSQRYCVHLFACVTDTPPCARICQSCSSSNTNSTMSAKQRRAGITPNRYEVDQTTIKCVPFFLFFLAFCYYLSLWCYDQQRSSIHKLRAYVEQGRIVPVLVLRGDLLFLYLFLFFCSFFLFLFLLMFLFCVDIAHVCLILLFI